MKAVTMRQFSQNASGHIRDMIEDDEPFILTRHGRFIAVITPFSDAAQMEMADIYLKRRRRGTRGYIEVSAGIPGVTNEPLQPPPPLS